jgi:hypothetical protein
MTLPASLKSGEVARLLPVTVDSNKEARAASILLATLSAVRPFREAMLDSIGLRSGKRATLGGYTEVVFAKDSAGGKSRPDGLLMLDTGGGKTWSALVEAKIGKVELEPEQVERYLALAKASGIDAVITISNQFATIPTHSPVKVSKAAVKGVALYHWSWVFAWTQAKLLLTENVFDNPAEKYILTEMARYFGHPNIGVSRFDRMNADWKDLVAKIQAGAVLPKTDASVEASVSSWHQEVRDLCLLMTRKLNAPVQAYISKPHRDDPELRMRDDCEHLVKNHKLYARLDIPDAAAPLEVVADLVRRSVCIYMSVTAPKDKKKTSARVSWLIKQLAKSNPENVYIRASWPGRAPITQALLKDLREDPALIEGGNKALAPVAFEVMLVRDMAAKFSGAKTFIEQLEEAVPRFYKDVGQHLRAYVAAPPKLQPKVQVAQEGDNADVLDPPPESHIDDMDEQVSSAPSSSLILGISDHEV